MAENAFNDFLANSDWGSMLLSMSEPGYVAGLPQYYSSPAGQQFGAASPRRGRYYQQAYSDVYSQYMGAWGTAMREGKEPASFGQFLETDPWTKRYGQLPQFERGVTKTYTDPRTRFIFY
jgi:hypothetical protein